jgi:hypothetical protein
MTKLQEFPDSDWSIEYVKTDLDGLFVKGTSWIWRGKAHGVTAALDASMLAMIDTKAEESSFWRVAIVINNNLVNALKRA